MKKPELFPLMDAHEKLEQQLIALHRLMALAGSKLDSDAHMACMSLCIDLDQAKSSQYRTLHNAVMGKGA